MHLNIYITIGLFLFLFWSIVLVAIPFSGVFLWVLGPEYSHLQSELICYLSATALAFSAHLFWGIALTRGWVKYGWIEIPLTIALQAIALLSLDLSNLNSAIVFGGISSFGHLVVGVGLVLFGASNHESSLSIRFVKMLESGSVSALPCYLRDRRALVADYALAVS